MPESPLLCPHLPIIGSMSLTGLGIQSFAENDAAAVSLAWPTANRTLYFPFAATAPFLVRNFWWVNGGTAAGSVDMSIHSLGGARLCSAGSTVQAGTNAPQLAPPTNIVGGGSVYLLTPGAYMMGIGATLNTTTFFAVQTGPGEPALWGCAEQTTAVPIPDPATFATCTIQPLPLCGVLDGTLM